MDSGPLLQNHASSNGLRRSAVTAATVLGMVCLGSVGWLVAQPQRWALIAATASTSFISSSSNETVSVELYGMAGCPYTRAFIEGPMTETLEIVPELIDFKFVPFGNSYWVTNKCGGTIEGMKFASYFAGYNATQRSCWDQNCGQPAEEGGLSSEGCFDGDLVCQHGVTDGMVTTAWNCAQDMAGNVHQHYWKFVTCTAKKFLAITTHEQYDNIVSSCATATGLDAHALMTCSKGDRGKKLFQASARATVPHSGVPLVRVDGATVDDTNCVACGDGIMQRVCEAVRKRGGSDGAVCQGIFGLI